MRTLLILLWPALASTHAVAQYYSETFDTDLGGWTVLNVDGNVDWQWTNSGPSVNTGHFAVPNLNTDSPQGWAMIDDDADGAAGITIMTDLVSPIINLMFAVADLRLEFDQYVQKVHPENASFHVGVSTDGTTWTETEICAMIGRTDRPNPEHIAIDISDQIAADPSQVRLRFRYVGTWDYGWQIDNLQITELPENDMRITATELVNVGAGQFPYTVSPLAQLPFLFFGADIVNSGHGTQTNVQLSLQVAGPTGVDNIGTLDVGNLAQGAVAHPSAPAYVPTQGPGEYTVTYTLLQDQVDQEPSNNTATATFAISPFTWGVDEGEMDDLQALAQLPGEGWEIGATYRPPHPGGSIEGIEAAIGAGTTVGTEVYGIVRDADFNMLATTGYHTVQASELNTWGGNSFITLPLLSPLPLQSDQDYLVMVGYDGGSDALVVSCSGRCVMDACHMYSPDGPTHLLSTRAPMVRALLEGGVGMHEHASLVSGPIFQPNPFSTTARVRFGLTGPAAVRIELHDALGRPVLAEDLGVLGAGEHERAISGEGLAPGVFRYGIVAGDTRRSGGVVHLE